VGSAHVPQTLKGFISRDYLLIYQRKLFLFFLLAQVFFFFKKKRKSVVLIVWNLVVHYLQFITGMTITKTK